MNELIKITEFYSDDNERIAKVYKDGQSYLVRCKTKNGKYYKTSFGELQTAEDFAEDWVNGNE